MGISAGWKAFTDPESQVRDMTREERLDMYAQAWAYYRAKMFSRRHGDDWTQYLAQRELYKHTRLIYNPVPMIVDFYVDNLWRPAANDQFESLVTPLTPKTDEKIIEAVAQIDQWSNFLSDMQKIKRYAAATGNILIEGVDDLVREKVFHRALWPGYLLEPPELNETGDVQGYKLEYEVFDPQLKGNYRYKKIVTKESFSYFRDDKPFVPDGKNAAVEANPYGFVFAIWIRHTDDGADVGVPACSHLDKVDEANSLGSHLHDNIHKEIESPGIISTKDEVLPIIGASQNPTTKRLMPQDPRLNWILFKTGEGATYFDIGSKLKLAEAHPYLKDILASFTDDYPELQAAAIIKENSQLSGAALERLLTPAQNRLDGVQPNYNQQLIKLRQMQLAVAGMRANGGGWTQRTEQRDKFKPFGLSSFERGELDFNLTKSVLVQNSEAEIEDVLTKKAARAVSLDGIVDQREQLSIAGYSEEQAKEIIDRQTKENELITDPNIIDPNTLVDPNTGQ
jgi:hypothetical protein